MREQGLLDVGRGDALVGSFDLAFGSRSIVVTDGDDHDIGRHWVEAALGILDGVKNKNGRESVVARIDSMRVLVRNRILSWPEEREFALYDEVRRLALTVMCRVVQHQKSERESE